jgi:diguanylate cyclase (GGDEF)-like protein
MDAKYLKRIFDNLEIGVVIFDDEYKVDFTNKMASDILDDNKNIKEAINEEYFSLLFNGVENRFTFFIKESPLKHKPVFKTSDIHYKLVIKPFKENYFIMEIIEQNALKKANHFLISQAMKNKKKLHILDKLVEIKKDILISEDMDTDEILSYYDEQLHFELSIDAAISEIYGTVLSQYSTLKEVASKMIIQMKKLTESEFGIVYTMNQEENHIYNAVAKVSDNSQIPYKSILPTEININKFNENYRLLWHSIRTKEPFYMNEPEYVDEKVKVNGHLSLPMILDNKLVGFVLLLNPANSYTKHDIRAVLRLGQMFSMALWRIWNEKKLEKMAMNDIMTGALNRMSGIEILKKAIGKSKRYFSDLTVVYIDINNLKKVNDTLGHIEGDWYIKTICDVIMSTKRETDDFVRLGGDEFLVILGDSAKGGKRLVDGLYAKLKKIREETDKDYDISISTGILEYDPIVYKTLDEYLEAADKKMYEDKKQYKERQQKKK